MTTQDRKMKLVWRVAPPPSGRLRAFEKRSWPSADYKGPGQKIAVSLLCADDYIPRLVREGKHSEITVTVAAWHDRPGGLTQSFVWRRLIKKAATLEEAKALAEKFLLAKPDYWPNEF